MQRTLVTLSQDRPVSSIVFGVQIQSVPPMRCICSNIVLHPRSLPQETAWELPPYSREVAPSATEGPAASALVPLQDKSASWTEVFDESTNSTYFFNTTTQVLHYTSAHSFVTSDSLGQFQRLRRPIAASATDLEICSCLQESSWELGTDDRMESGIYCSSNTDETALGPFDSGRRHEGGELTPFNWRDHVRGRKCVDTRTALVWTGMVYPPATAEVIFRRRGLGNCAVSRYESTRPPAPQFVPSFSRTPSIKVLKEFQVPQTVSEAVGRAASAQIWPPTLDGRPSRLERWDVLKARI